MAVEEAQGATVPEMGRVIRNLMMGAFWLHDAVLHFYHLAALDYIDATAVLNYQGNVPELIGVRDKIKALAEAGDLHPILPTYTPDDFCVRDPDLVTQLVYHYIRALDIQAKSRKAAAIFGGKQPHHASMIPGGVTIIPTIEQIKKFKGMLTEIVDFVKNVYIPDALLLCTGPLLPLEQESVGATAGHYLSYGGYPLDNNGNYLFPSGVIFDNDFSKVQPFNRDDLTEEVGFSWYKDEPTPAHPFDRKVEVDLEKQKAYTFIQAPRYQGKPMEVGPLARMLVMQYPPFMELLSKNNITKPGMVMRHAARAYDALVMADVIFEWIDELMQLVGDTGIYGKEGNALIHDTAKWEPVDKGQGAGLNEAPRGALGHFITIEDKKVLRYQMVVPSTWNFSPRDDRGQLGPIEEALKGAPVPDPDNPINVGRIIRSFNPCMACAIHIIHPKGDREYSLMPTL
jgi:hydrogenase large subunit